VKSDAERELGEVVGVRLLGAFLDPLSMTAVVEYLVKLAGPQPSTAVGAGGEPCGVATWGGG